MAMDGDPPGSHQPRSAGGSEISREQSYNSEHHDDDSCNITTTPSVKTGNSCNNNPQTLYGSQELYSSSQFLHQEQEENLWCVVRGPEELAAVVVAADSVLIWDVAIVSVDSVKFIFEVDMNTGNSCNKNTRTLYSRKEIYSSSESIRGSTRTLENQGTTYL